MMSSNYHTFYESNCFERPPSVILKLTINSRTKTEHDKIKNFVTIPKIWFIDLTSKLTQLAHNLERFSRSTTQPLFYVESYKLKWGSCNWSLRKHRKSRTVQFLFKFRHDTWKLCWISYKQYQNEPALRDLRQHSIIMFCTTSCKMHTSIYNWNVKRDF